MMIALHKKCNSIISGPSMSILNATQKISKATPNISSVDLVSSEQNDRKINSKKEVQGQRESENLKNRNLQLKKNIS